MPPVAHLPGRENATADTVLRLNKDEAKGAALEMSEHNAH